MPNTEVRGTKKLGAALLMKTKQESAKFLPKQRSFQSNHFFVCFFCRSVSLWMPLKDVYLKICCGLDAGQNHLGPRSFSLVALWLPKEKVLCKVALMFRMAGTNKKQMVEGLYWRDSNCRHIWSENVAIKRILRTSPVSYLSTQKVKQEKGRG